MSKDKLIQPILDHVLQDKNQNGMPDIVEQALQNQGGGTNPNITTQVATTYVVRGKQYNSLEEMPAEDRAYVEKKMQNIKLPKIMSVQSTQQSYTQAPGSQHLYKNRNYISIPASKRNIILISLFFISFLLIAGFWIVYYFKLF